MIDVRDLMVGSYLCYNGNADIWFEVGNITSFTLTRVEAVGGGDVMRRAYKAGVELYKNIFSERQISGIPITPEWLEKLGFTRNPDYEEFYPKGNENVNVTYKDDSYFFDYDCPRDVEWCRRYVEHVHQLQNHYYLMTGEELTIEVEK